MSLEKLIPYIVQHNAVIIQALVASILLLVIFIAYRNFAAARQGEGSLAPSAGGDLSQLEATLKKLLEKANQVPAPSTGSPGDNPALLTEIEKLKKSLEEKQGTIEKLRVESEAAKAAGGTEPAAGLSNEDRGQLESQIKDLQAKLSEYEIISEDIADLSFYKEENVKLARELETFKKGGAPSAAPASTPAAAASASPAAPAAPDAPKAAPVMAGSAKATTAAAVATAAETVAAPPAPAPEPAAAVEPTPTPTPVEPTPAPAEPTPAVAAEPAKVVNPHAAVDDDLMAEFAAAVEQQKKHGSAAATPAAPAKAAAAPAAPTAPTPVPAAEDDSPLGSGLDVDKVALEVSQLEAMGNSDVVNSLEGELNPDKILEEAATMESIKPEDAKLMNDFEDFVKKGGVG